MSAEQIHPGDDVTDIQPLYATPQPEAGREGIATVIKNNISAKRTCNGVQEPVYMGSGYSVEITGIDKAVDAILSLRPADPVGVRGAVANEIEILRELSKIEKDAGYTQSTWQMLRTASAPRALEGEANNLSQQLIKASLRETIDTDSATLMLHASSLIDRFLAAPRADREAIARIICDHCWGPNTWDRPTEDGTRNLCLGAADATLSMEEAISATKPAQDDVIASRIKELEDHLETAKSALQFAIDGYDDQDTSHHDYRVKVYGVALDAMAENASDAEGSTVVAPAHREDGK